MKATAIAMFAILLLLAGLTLWRGPETFNQGLRASGTQLLKFLPVMVVAIALAGFAEVLLPTDLVEHWLSDAAGWRGIAIAWLAGIITPGGSIVGMPLIVTLFQAGVGIGVLVTYMTSLALMSLLRLPIEIGFYGWRLTLLRISVSIFLPPLAGVMAQIAAPLFIRTR